MEKPSFATVHASIRPPRVAVLVDKNDQDWQHTCLRIIEFYSGLWGGAYNLIIPTDGNVIDERFWTILEVFDPDYLYRYQKTGEDLYLCHPNQYQEVLARRVDAARDEGWDAAAIRSEIDEHLRGHWLSEFNISSVLQEEVKRRLAPFWFEEYAVDAGAVSAGCTGDFHLTSLATIITNTEHSNAIAAVEVSEGLIPQLWFGAVTGCFSPEAIRSFEQLGIGEERYTFNEGNLGDLIEFVVTGQLRRIRNPESTIYNNFPGSLPFNVSMLQLGLYRSTRYRYWDEPLVIVAGNSFEDFCLYYCLARLRDRVVWALPSITEKALASGANAPLTPAELSFLFDVSHAERSNKFKGGTACVSYSLTSEQVDSVIQQLNRAGRQYARAIRKIDSVQSLVTLPLTAVERDSFQRDIPVQLSDSRSISPFSTPKPKHFSPVHPYEHRWITQLSVAGGAPPKHCRLGAWIVPSRQFSTLEARVGREGPAYFCPNVVYFGGDIDTVLVRPNLYLPPLVKIVEHLAREKGYECRPSDKGIYAEESISKWGGLEQAANFLRNAGYRAVLDQFLDTSKSEPDKGVYLGSDHRRYLDLRALDSLIGNKATTLIDDLISKQILYRGFIFQCGYCRNADWFSVNEITQEFRCRRCGRSQIYTSCHWKKPDEPAWFYKLDELVYLGYRNGMAVSLLALDHMRKKAENSFTFTTDREFWASGEPKPKVEADFFCVVDGVFTAGEAKKENNLGNSSSEESAKIKKYKHLVSGLAVRQIVFATMSERWQQKTVEAVRATFAGEVSVQVLFLDRSHFV